MGKWSTYRRRGSADGSAIVSQFVSRVAAAGGSVSNATILALNTLVVSLQNAGLWEKFLDVWPCCGTGLPAALVKLKVAPGTATSYTSVNFVAGDYNESGGSGGLLSDGSTKYLTGGATPTQFALSSHLFASVLAVTAAAGNRAWAGVLSGTDQFWLGGLAGTTSTDARLGSNTGAALASAMAAGNWCGSRENLALITLYKNGVSQATSATPVTGLTSALGCYLFAWNNGGAVGAQVLTRLAGHTSGSGLIASEAASLHTIWAAFNTALGR